MKIYKKKDKIIFEIDYWTPRHNPYMEGENVGSHPTLIGLLCKDKFGNDEMGFAKVIDMDYKGKSDQFTDIMIHYWGDEKEFKKICEDLKIGWIDYSFSDTGIDYEND